MSQRIHATRVPCTQNFGIYLMIKANLSDSEWDNYLSAVKECMEFPELHILLHTTRGFNRSWYRAFEYVYRETSELLAGAGSDWCGLDQSFNIRRFLMETVVHLAGVHHNKLRKATYRQKKKAARRTAMMATDAGRSDTPKVSPKGSEGEGEGEGACVKVEEGEEGEE